LMAGLRAGTAHNTFPTMSGQWIPPGLFEQSPWWINLFENPTTVQFVHRWLAKLLVLGVLVMAWRARRAEAVLAAAMALMQLSLGIATILTGVEIAVATLHQAGAVILLTFVIVVRHRATPSRASPVSAIVGGGGATAVWLMLSPPPASPLRLSEAAKTTAPSATIAVPESTSPPEVTSADFGQAKAPSMTTAVSDAKDKDASSVDWPALPIDEVRNRANADD